MTDKELLIIVERFKKGLKSRATYFDNDKTVIEEYNVNYIDDRKLLLQSKIKDNLPRFVLTCRNSDEFWQHIKQFRTYDERRKYLDKEFENIFLELENIINGSIGIFVLEKINSEYIEKQVQIMLKMQKENPTEAIGKAREIIESVCKTILDNKKVQYDDSTNLVKEVLKVINLLPKHIQDNSTKLSENIKRIISGLETISNNIFELRNNYGSGHGKSADFIGLQNRHAQLAVGSAITIINFLWNTYYSQNDRL